MYYYQNNFMFLFCIPKVEFKKKKHCTTIYMYIYTYTHTQNLYVKNTALSQLCYTIEVDPRRSL